jgi:hypothetical protein
MKDKVAEFNEGGASVCTKDPHPFLENFLLNNGACFNGRTWTTI